jgi:hypothetical protein
VTSEKYPKWRNLSLITILMALRFEVETSQVVKATKIKRISNKEEVERRTTRKALNEDGYQ